MEKCLAHTLEACWLCPYKHIPSHKDPEVHTMEVTALQVLILVEENVSLGVNNARPTL